MHHLGLSNPGSNKAVVETSHSREMPRDRDRKMPRLELRKKRRKRKKPSLKDHPVPLNPRPRLFLFLEEYKVYLRMLKFGVHIMSVKQKMEGEGFDADELDVCNTLHMVK